MFPSINMLAASCDKVGNTIRYPWHYQPGNTIKILGIKSRPENSDEFKMVQSTTPAVS